MGALVNKVKSGIGRMLQYAKSHKRNTAIILTLIILAAVFWPKPPKPIETEKVKRADIVESLSASGTLSSENSVNLNFLASGRLVYLRGKKGELVKEGQTIAVLDQRSVQKTLEDNLRDYSKQRNSFDQTNQDNQNRTPEGALNDTMKRILQNNQYDLEKAVISVELQDLAKQQAVLTTPISGIITRADVEHVGVNISVTTTFSVADPDNILFKIDVDEADIGKVQIGQKVKVNFDSFPDETVELVVDAIDFQSHESNTGGNVYNVEAKMPPNQFIKYRLGMSGDAEIIIEQKNSVLVVSLASLSDENSVYIKNGDFYEIRKVKTGIQSDTEIEILSGLEEGEVVALQPDEAAKRPISSKKRFFFF